MKYTELRQQQFDAAYATLERSRPRWIGHRLEHRSYNDFCREMDSWSAEYDRVLKADEKDACQ